MSIDCSWWGGRVSMGEGAEMTKNDLVLSSVRSVRRRGGEGGSQVKKGLVCM